MRIADYYHMAFKALRDRKLRTGLTVLGIVIGCSLIVALVASTSGLSASVQAQVDKIGVTTLQVFSTSQRTPITDQDVAAVKNMAGVQDVIPYFSKRSSINYGSSTLSVSIVGFDQTKLTSLYKGLTVAEGTTVGGFDPTGAVIGTDIAFPPNDSGFPPIGVNGLVSIQATSSGKGKGAPPTYTFIAKGIMAPYGTVGFTNLDESIFTSMSARTLFGIKYYSGMYVIVNSADNVNDVLASLQSYFGGNARVFSSTALLQTVQSITGSLTLFLGGVAVVTLMVAAVGIANTMFVSVMERTREIGIMKAIGYRPKQILSLFLYEAALTGIAGAIIGTLFGIFLSFLLGGGISSSFNFQPRGFGGAPRPAVQTSSTSYAPVFSTQLFIFSLTFPIILAVLAGLYPAWRASKMNAVIALKYD